MDQLIEKYRRRLAYIETDFVRSAMQTINWNARLIGIKGARGVGKTTLMLQYIKLHLADQLASTLYVSLDNLWFSQNSLSSLVDNFVKKGGKYLFLDEVHKYPQWSVEIKNLYDDYPALKIVFTGSSLLEIHNARADLSRRAVVYTMQGLSYREYLNMELNTRLESYSLEEILTQHADITSQICEAIKPLQYFSGYLNSGYYPFYKEFIDLYHTRVEEVVNLILEVELPQLRNINLAYLPRLKQLLLIIAQSAPFVPNISKLSERIGINRETLLAYLWHLNESQLIFSVYKDAGGISKLQKPDKVFLENTNFMFVLGFDSVNTGNLRETFFVNQLKHKHKIEIAKLGDFIINGKHTFEIGGQHKTKRQIKTIANAYIAADDIEYGFDNKIPLWLFGFLY